MVSPPGCGKNDADMKSGISMDKLPIETFTVAKQGHTITYNCLKTKSYMVHVIRSLLDFWIINSTAVSQAGLWAFHGPTFWGSKAADCRGGQTGNTPSRHHKLKLHPLMNIKSHIIQTSIPGMSLSPSKSVLEVVMISMISMQIKHFFEEDPHIFGRFFFGEWRDTPHWGVSKLEGSYGQRGYSIAAFATPLCALDDASIHPKNWDFLWETLGCTRVP